MPMLNFVVPGRISAKAQRVKFNKRREGNRMASGWHRPLRTAQLSCLLLWASAALAQASPAWVDPPVDLSRLEVLGPAAMSGEAPAATPIGPATSLEVQDTQADRGDRLSTFSAYETRPDPTARVQTAQPSSPTPAGDIRQNDRAQSARDLAVRYLDVWSAPNHVALGSASSFYGSSVVFHGQRRSFASVLAEKRRFAERWPQRSYRYRPTTMQVACGAQVSHCTVRSLFDFSASDPRRGRRSLGTGEHELVVSFASNRPAIAVENSRVLKRSTRMRK
jgi:hypothetical protein